MKIYEENFGSKKPSERKFGALKVGGAEGTMQFLTSLLVGHVEKSGDLVRLANL